MREITDVRRRPFWQSVKLWFSDKERVLTSGGMIAFALTIFLAFVLFGCAQPVQSDKTDKQETHKIYVVNSLWQIVKTIEVTSSREIIGDDINEEVEAYNVETLDDFLRVYYDTVPDITNAPLVSVFSCNPITYQVNWSVENVSRMDLVQNVTLWRQASFGQILFIDHVPPPPVVIPPLSLYAFYAIYEVDNTTGDIVLEDHCGYQPDESFTGQWITDPAQGGWASVDAYYLTIKHAYEMDAIPTANNVHVIANHALYMDQTP